MPSYICKTIVHFNGEPFAADDKIDLSAKDADPLLRVGAIEPAPDAKARKDPGTGQTKSPA